MHYGFSNSSALAARWTRYGVQLIVTPDRLIAKRHWTRGGKLFDLALDQIESVRRSECGISINGRWEQVEIETAIQPKQQTAIVNFLQQSLTGHSRSQAAISGKATSTGPITTFAASGGLEREFRYREGLVWPILGILPALALAAVVSYLAIHNTRAADTWWRGSLIRLSRQGTTIGLWACVGILCAFALWCVRKIFDHFAQHGRLVLRPDGLALFNDRNGTVREIVYRDVTDLRIVTDNEGATQLKLVIDHPEGTIDLERHKLPCAADFGTVRDAITSGFDSTRAPNR